MGPTGVPFKGPSMGTPSDLAHQPPWEGPPRPSPPPPPRSEDFPFFSEAAVQQLLRRCSNGTTDRPQMLWRPQRWRLSPRNERDATMAAPSPQALVAKACHPPLCPHIPRLASHGSTHRYLLHALRRLRTACFIAGDVQVHTEWQRVKCEVLLHASLRHPLICPLQGVVIDEDAGLLLLLFPRRHCTLQQWNKRTAAFTLPPEDKQEQQEEQQHACEDPKICGCLPILLYTEEVARILLKQVKTPALVSLSPHFLLPCYPLLMAVSALHALRVVHKDIKPSNILLLRALPPNAACRVWMPPLRRRASRGKESSTAAGPLEDCEGQLFSDAEVEDSSEDEQDCETADSFLFASAPTLAASGDSLLPLRKALLVPDSRPLPRTPHISALHLQLSHFAASASAADSGAATAAAPLVCFSEERQVPLYKALKEGLLEAVAFPPNSSSDTEEATSCSNCSADEDSEHQEDQQEEQQEHGVVTGKRARQRSRRVPRDSPTDEPPPTRVSKDTLQPLASDEEPGTGGYCIDEQEVLLQLTDFNTAVVADDDACTIWDAAGSPHFVPPECLGTGDAAGTDGRARDMWAVGMTLFCMLFGRPPFWGCRGLDLACRLMREDLKTPAWRCISPECTDILRRLLHRDPRERMTVAEALRHPWVTAQSQIQQCGLDA
ncbi:atypical mek-related protein kinase (incomplete catalytic triad) [Cyclospora cayetanensis]|uniref:Atypical mek-related protein kinase (Incomplete catalytic triad) n=1 Tax=Cyclospora cayetanensis TaxID=88456 RepID=A0A1D3CWG8_9EIME|nr:atypical mek-related protein kinase (incomplete catalytic triad) [Cyclospora cayetanensis]